MSSCVGFESPTRCQRAYERAHVVVSSRDLPDRVPSHPSISERLARSEEFEGVLDLDIGPAREEDLDGLLDFAVIGPDHGLEELGQGTLIAGEVEAMTPD
jgi:hypothetical protein